MHSNSQDPVSQQHTPPECDINSKDLGRIACARCRRLKIKCIFDSESTTVCKRCANSNSICEEAKSTRKPKRNGDDRVAHLEETVQILESRLRQMHHNHSSPHDNGYYRKEMPIILPAIKTSASSSPLAERPSITRPRQPEEACRQTCSLQFDSGGIDELIASGILTQQRLIELYELSKQFLAAGLSPLQIPSHMTYWDMYRQKPILLQVLITIATNNDATLYSVLSERMRNRLLFEYFINNTRRLELVQAFCMACDYLQPNEQSNVWGQHSYAPLATEVALDIGLFSPPVSREEGFDDLDHERTVLWLNSMYTAMLTNNRRQPQRVLWTEYHVRCKTMLEVGNYRDRQLAKLTTIPRLLLEIQECGTLLKSKQLVDAFQTRILNLEADFGSTPHPAAQMGISLLVMTLHETHIRSSEVTGDNTQLIISMELCKNAAISILYTAEQLPGNVLGYPTFYLVRPLQALLSLCKIFRYLDQDDGFVERYAARADQALASFQDRGSGLAKNMVGKPAIVLRWFREADVISSEDAGPQIIQWNNRRMELEALEGATDLDFQTFVDMFQITQ